MRYTCSKPASLSEMTRISFYAPVYDSCAEAAVKKPVTPFGLHGYGLFQKAVCRNFCIPVLSWLFLISQLCDCMYYFDYVSYAFLQRRGCTLCSILP